MKICLLFNFFCIFAASKFRDIVSARGRMLMIVSALRVVWCFVAET